MTHHRRSRTLVHIGWFTVLFFLVALAIGAVYVAIVAVVALVEGVGRVLSRAMRQPPTWPPRAARGRWIASDAEIEAAVTWFDSTFAKGATP